MRMPLGGAARVLLVAGAGLGLVALAQADPRTVGLGAQSSGAVVAAPAADAAATVPLRTRLLTCAGQELSGTAGVPDVPLAGEVAAASLPTPLRPPGVTGQGTLAIGDGPSQPAASAAEAGQQLTAPLASGGGTPTVRAAGALAPGVAAGQEWSSDTPTLRGLAGTACPQASADMWLIAGGGAPGRQERLVLTNPGANEVSATVEVLGAQGRVPGATDRRVVVPAEGRAVVLVDALAASEPAPVVHVTVSGGTVSATLTDTWLDGSVPAGAETTGPTAAPALTQVIPVARLDQAGAVRIAVPGSDQAVVSVRLLTPTGPVPVGTSDGGVARIQPGSVLELPLPAGTPGVVGVDVHSDVPVLAAALSVARADGAVGDFAWSAGASAVTGVSGAAFAGTAPTRQLTLVATGGETRAQVVVLQDGTLTTSEVTVAADSVVAKDLGSPQAVWVVRTGGAGELRAGVLSRSGSGSTALISALALADLPLTTAATAAVPLP